MAMAFCGTWRCIESKNFAEYLTAIGAPLEIRKHGTSSSPTTIVSRDGDKIVVKIEHGAPTFSTVDMSFKLGEEFDEATSDGRKCRSVVNMDDAKMVYVQKWDGKEATIIREIQDGKLLAKLVFEDVVAVRTYEKA